MVYIIPKYVHEFCTALHTTDESSKKSGELEVNFQEWKKKPGRSVTQITKPPKESLITVKPTHEKTAMMTSQQTSFNSNDDEIGEYISL